MDERADREAKVAVAASNPRWTEMMENVIEDAEKDAREIRRFERWLAARVQHWEVRPLYDELPLAVRDAR